MKSCLLRCLRGYQRVNASLVALGFPLVRWSGCRSFPTCSQYAVEVIEQRGVLRGGVAAVRRAVSCHA